MLLKTLAGFLQLAVIMAVLLFVPAGAVRYWQAWIYLAVFLGCSCAITIDLWGHDRQLLERRLKAGPGAEIRKSQNLIQALASACFIAILVVPALDHRFGWSHVSLATEAIGDVTTAIGFFVVHRTFQANSFSGATIQIAQQQSVISTGPYSLVRHPMYAGALILLLGTPLALGSLWGLLPLIPMTAVLVARLLDEEDVLTEGLHGYREYCQTVRFHLVPFIW